VRVQAVRPDHDALEIRFPRVKGYRGEDTKNKANTMEAFWVPGVNNLGTFGRWAFAEFTESVYAIAANFHALVARAAAGNTR
jgi:type III restriction enzyme